MVPRHGIVPYKEVGGWLSAMDAGLSMSRSEIICPIKGKAMRKLTVDGDTVHIEAGPDEKDVSIDTFVI